MSKISAKFDLHGTQPSVLGGAGSARRLRFETPQPMLTCARARVEGDVRRTGVHGHVQAKCAMRFVRVWLVMVSMAGDV